MNDSMPPRVGFIGTGWTDRIQIPAFRLGGLYPQAIASRNVDNARRVADEQNLPEFHADWRDLIESETVDIVSIATPPHRHGEMATAALEAGKHVICEKPTALNLTEAEGMLAAAQAAPEQLAIIDHELRFTPQRQTMRRLFRENAVGRALWVELTWCSPQRLDAAAPWTWWSDSERGGGVLGATGSHLLDLGRWMFGRIEALSAQLKTAHTVRTETGTGAKRRVTADDHAHLDIRFSNGINGAITASAIAPGASGMTITLYGTDGALRLDSEDRLWGVLGDAFPTGNWAEIHVDDPVAQRSDLPAQSAFARGSVYLAQAVADTLQRGERWIAEAASFYDGLTVQQMLDSARRSSREKTWIDL